MADIGEPRMGPVLPDWQRGLCCYAPDEGSLLCLREAAWHGIDSQYRGLECCDEHKPIMQALARWIHPLEDPCALPEGRFYEQDNVCRVPWEQVEIPAVEAAVLRGDTNGAE